MIRKELTLITLIVASMTLLSGCSGCGKSDVEVTEPSVVATTEVEEVSVEEIIETTIEETTEEEITVEETTTEEETTEEETTTIEEESTVVEEATGVVEEPAPTVEAQSGQTSSVKQEALDKLKEMGITPGNFTISNEPGKGDGNYHTDREIILH